MCIRDSSILERLGGRITFTALAGGGLAAVATLPTLARALSLHQAAERSGIAQRTMEVHRANILRKLGVKTPEDIRRLLEMAAAEKS